MEIAPGIHRIETPFGDRFVCLYLLVGEEAVLLIDTGIDETPRRYLLPYLEQIGLDPARIRYVLISHSDFDHMAGNRAVHELAPAALFLCHRLDQAMVEDIDLIIRDRYEELGPDHGFFETDEGKAGMRAQARTVPVDIALSGGERIRLGPDWAVEVWHTPGHSRGHVTVHDPRSGSLIICDAALYHAVLRADGSPAFPPTYRYVETYSATLDRLAAAAPALLLTSHYPVYAGEEAQAFLAESQAFVERVDQTLLAELAAAAAPRTLQQLVAGLGPWLGRWPEAANGALSQPLIGHLEQLQAFGKLEVDRYQGHVTYALRP